MSCFPTLIITGFFPLARSIQFDGLFLAKIGVELTSPVLLCSLRYEGQFRIHSTSRSASGECVPSPLRNRAAPFPPSMDFPCSEYYGAVRLPDRHLHLLALFGLSADIPPGGI